MSTPDVESPKPRNFTKEMLQTLEGFQQTAGGYFGLESEYQPKYGQLNLDLLRQNLTGYTDASGQHQPGQLELGRMATGYQRAGDVADVARLGPAATEAFLRSNPFLASSLVNLSQRTNDSPILDTLNQQAGQALASGGQLSPQQARDVDQQSRAGYASRGMAMGNQSLASEILSRDSAVQQRMAGAQQLAAGVQGLNQQQNDFVGRASQIFGSTLSDPFQAILGRSSGAGTSSGSGGYGGTGQMIGTGAQLFNPLNPYAQDVYNSNFNQQGSANIANANNQAASNNAWLTAAATIAGAALSDERIKTKIKDTGEKTAEGIPIKEWTYKTDPKKKRYRGVMAQDVEEFDPFAVLTDPRSGLKAVDYGRLSANMTEVAAGKGN